MILIEYLLLWLNTTLDVILSVRDFLYIKV